MGARMAGEPVAAPIREAVAGAAAELRSGGIEPCLATVLVGDDPASATYVGRKHAACGEAGILTRDVRLGAGATQEEVLGAVRELDSDPSVHGILVQLPLPGGLDPAPPIAAISPSKDVDGLTPQNAGLLASGRPALVPCTPAGVMAMLDHYGVETAGRAVTIINRSGLVGRPLCSLLLGRDATVTVCHSRTRDIGGICAASDVIITAVGDRSRFTLGPEMVGEGAVVVDVAISRVDGRLAGDVDYDAVIQKASLVSPVPGGVGPMTVAMLLRNTITAASLGGQAGRR
ncbi:MAG: bifunctional 5,10-methylenetetrahydrofolate dehydrogenase/5,10-methenyltetrahydrofolate cyclohydrolase [Nitrosopumilus sp.]|nr:bifunctional 5,10-methylenetetrahydrofolate dehydrogenase/5,10-methenyltetrahydrofolate cyclohydrolase [Nitrosopumilus sp.]MDA7952970.1 bifunctional 5,10-methylenetetrahydrofolate dehydrogenase/5,10-methenyltetrahydrofolate cyclohydrolase [Nitrosopumilus sp.]MDA7957940.1 bifunctional 5,10-methylenetetrahydrofolate dehydrogenase/5,10-methenyltetrahydrofolate cyclohydrolase [Nitrosopumilus sp.]